VGKEAEVEAVKGQWGADRLGQATLILRKGSNQAGSPLQDFKTPNFASIWFPLQG